MRADRQSQRMAILSDIHGNTAALEAVLADIQHQACRQVLVLGDIINGFDPHGSLELLRSWSDQQGVTLSCIKGNAEMYLLTPGLEDLPGKDEPMNAAVLALIGWFKDHLTPEDLEWIESFPSWLRWGSACLVHDTPQDRLHPESWHKTGLASQYQEWFYHSPGIQPGDEQGRWERLLSLMRAEGFAQVYCGHTHVAFTREISGRLVCGVGSAGLPLDGDPCPCWALVQENPDGRHTVRLQRVQYDISRAQEMVDRNPDFPDHGQPGFAQAYKRWLATGILWQEQRKQGEINQEEEPNGTRNHC
jgi:predicted phosphodiesterase